MKSATVVMALSFSVAALGGCAGCVAGLPAEAAEPFFTSGAKADAASRALPRPTRRVVAAVYGIQDQTGKLSFGPFGPDAGLMLVRALRNAGGGGWFDVVDRDGLRAYAARQASGPDQAPGSPRAIAIDCVVTRFETATEHGGEGARLLGADPASPHWRITVAVDLQISNPFTGKRLGRVSIQERLYGAPEPDGGIQYASVGGRAPTRTGVALGGLSEMAVREAMEKAVHGLVLQGAAQRLWAVSGSPAPKKKNKKLTASVRLAKTAPARTAPARTASTKPASIKTAAPQTLRVEAPQIQAPQMQTPQAQTPQIQAPQVQTPPVKTPRVITQDGIPAEAMSPELMSPELMTPELKTSPLKAPEANTTTQSLAPASPSAPSAAPDPAASPTAPWLTKMQAFGEVK